VFNNNSVFTPNTFIDLDLVSSKNESTSYKIYPRVRVFFSVEGLIYIFVGNYQTDKFIQRYGLNADIQDNQYQIITKIDEQSSTDSYYIFANNQLKFISNDITKYPSWNLSFLKTVNNIYVSNKNFNSNIDSSVSGLNFSLVASDSDMNSANIFRIDNNYFSVGDMDLVLNKQNVPLPIKVLYNNNNWKFRNKQ
jgi:hypothetical protein